MGKIIWLASYPKSGNTWLRAFLHNLLRNAEESHDINTLTDFTLGEAQAAWFQKYDPRKPEEMSIEEVAKLRPKVHLDMTKAFPDSVFVKTHSAVMEDHEVPVITPELTAGAIYVVRNPLDVVISYSHHLGSTLDQTISFMANARAISPASATHVHEMLGSWSEHVESWTAKPSAGLHAMRYEDMLEAPTKTFGALARFLGLNPPRDRLERAIKLSSFKVLREQERRKGFKEKSPVAERFFREGRAGQWKKLLTPEQVAQVVEAHRTQMARFDYLPKGL